MILGTAGINVGHLMLFRQMHPKAPVYGGNRREKEELHAVALGGRQVGSPVDVGGNSQKSRNGLFWPRPITATRAARKQLAALLSACKLLRSNPMSLDSRLRETRGSGHWVWAHDR